MPSHARTKIVSDRSRRWRVAMWHRYIRNPGESYLATHPSALSQ